MQKLSISQLRSELGLSLEEFGSRIGVASKGYLSKIERGLEPASPTVALAIEKLSNGRIDAADLNPIVAQSREPVALDSAPRILCEICERRLDGTVACLAVDCPHADRFAESEAA